MADGCGCSFVLLVVGTFGVGGRKERKNNSLDQSINVEVYFDSIRFIHSLVPVSILLFVRRIQEMSKQIYFATII